MATGGTRVHMEATVAADPDAVFTHFTDRFADVWPGEIKRLEPGSDPDEPNGLGMIRSVKPPGSGALVEEIVTHERPRLIEYKVIDEEAAFRNHLGRIVFSEQGGGTHIDYTITYDYRHELLGPVTKLALETTWRLHSSRRLRADLGG